jgi:hypothetical protein
MGIWPASARYLAVDKPARPRKMHENIRIRRHFRNESENMK